MSTLTVLSEDYNILPYLQVNGLFPTRISYYTEDIISDASFVDEDTLYLVIIHGLTRFNTAELRSLFDTLHKATAQGACVKVMSDIALNMADLFEPGIEYVQYSGDLFFGTYRWTNKRGKVLKDTVKEDDLASKASSASPNCPIRTGYWLQFAEFTDPDIVTQVDAQKESTTAFETSDDRFMSMLLTAHVYD